MPVSGILNPMRLLVVADGHSPIAQNWVRYFAEGGDEVYFASTYPFTPDFPLRELEIIPAAFSGRKRPGSGSRPGSSKSLKLLGSLRHLLGPLTLPRAGARLRAFVERVKPDLVHAMRIPFEGMLAAEAYSGIPLLVSVWGNDFTLHAPSTPLMGHYTRWTLKVADALHADCRRDIRLSREWGYDPSGPTLVMPANGGIRRDIFYSASRPVNDPVIINPRGIRAYVRNDIFFQAIPLVLAKLPQARFICPGMAGESQALQWIEKLQIGASVELLPLIPYSQWAEVFRRACVLVSPSLHDGTPNSLLEGIACGCFPIAGDLESIREWITDGKNGLLVNANRPESLAEAILTAMQNKDLREQAAGLNQKIILERADYKNCMAEAKKYYERIRA